MSPLSPGDWPENTEQSPPEHIRSSFQVGSATPAQLEDVWSRGWRCDRAVISPSGEPARANWLAKFMTKIRPIGVAIARPITSSDGRYSVSGWRARSFLSGHPAPRFDEMAAAALRLNEASRGEACPDFLRPLQSFSPETNVFRAAEEAVFAEDPAPIIAAVMGSDAVPTGEAAEALSKALALLSKRGTIQSESQLVHGDIAGCTIFDGTSDPILTDYVPAWRPAGWSVALLIVDCMAWGNAPDTLLERWAHIEDFNELALRAAAYRLLIHAMLPTARSQAGPGLLRVANVVASLPERGPSKAIATRETVAAVIGGDMDSAVSTDRRSPGDLSQ